MAVRRTPQVKAQMDQVIQLAVDLLEHPSMPVLPNQRHEPRDIVRYLQLCRRLLDWPGRLQEKKYVLGDLQIAADYLSHPAIDSLPFVVKPSLVARDLREIVRNLK